MAAAGPAMADGGALSGDGEDSGGVELESVTGRVEMRGVDFAYPSQPHVPILRGFLLSVLIGKTIALCSWARNDGWRQPGLRRRMVAPVPLASSRWPVPLPAGALDGLLSAKPRQPTGLQGMLGLALHPKPRATVTGSEEEDVVEMFTPVRCSMKCQ